MSYTEVCAIRDDLAQEFQLYVLCDMTQEEFTRGSRRLPGSMLRKSGKVLDFLSLDNHCAPGTGGKEFSLKNRNLDSRSWII